MTIVSLYVGLREAAEILGVHYLTVLKAVQRNDIPSIKVGRQYRIPRKALDPQNLIPGGRGEEKSSSD